MPKYVCKKAAANYTVGQVIEVKALHQSLRAHFTEVIEGSDEGKVGHVELIAEIDELKLEVKNLKTQLTKQGNSHQKELDEINKLLDEATKETEEVEE